MMTAPIRVTTTLASTRGLAAAAIVALGLAGCNTRSPETTG